MHTTILYHGRCLDGIASAFARWQVFGDDAQYLPVAYGEPVPDIPPEHHIMIVDFSYDADIILALYERHQHVIVLDHHKSAQAVLATVPDIRAEGRRLACYFDLHECGASLTWKYLHGGGWAPARDPDPHGMEYSMPTFFKYVRDRDLWEWKLSDSKPISLAYWACDKDFLSMAQFAQDLDEAEGMHRIITEGKAMQRYADALVQEQAARAVWGEIAGYQVPIINATTLFSEVGDYLCTTRPEIPFCAYFFFRDDKVQWGLRSHGPADVSLVAKQYGGGGHAQAAGFVTERTAVAQMLSQLPPIEGDGW